MGGPSSADGALLREAPCKALMETVERPGRTSQRGFWKILALQGLSARCWEACTPFLQTQFLNPKRCLRAFGRSQAPGRPLVGGPGRFWEGLLEKLRLLEALGRPRRPLGGPGCRPLKNSESPGKVFWRFLGGS